MTPLLAMAPAATLGERVVIAAIGFGLALTLARSLARWPAQSPAGLRRLIACFAAALCIGAFASGDGRGILAFVGGACCGGLVHGPRLRAGPRPGPGASPGRSAWGLMLACILLGPLFALVVLGIVAQQGRIMAVDWAYAISVFILVGLYAGILAAMVVGAIVALASRRSTSGREGDSRANATAVADQTPDRP